MREEKADDDDADDADADDDEIIPSPFLKEVCNKQSQE